MKTSILAVAAIVLMGSAGFASAESIKPQCNRFLLWDLCPTFTYRCLGSLGCVHSFGRSSSVSAFGANRADWPGRWRSGLW